MIIVETNEAKLLEAIEKPYNVNGNEGISYKLRVLISDEIFEFKSSSHQVESMRGLVGKTGKAKIAFSSPKERLTAHLVSLDVK